jgi:hypothetical protein
MQDEYDLVIRQSLYGCPVVTSVQAAMQIIVIIHSLFFCEGAMQPTRVVYSTTHFDSDVGQGHVSFCQQKKSWLDSHARYKWHLRRTAGITEHDEKRTGATES